MKKQSQVKGQQNLNQFFKKHEGKLVSNGSADEQNQKQDQVEKNSQNDTESNKENLQSKNLIENRKKSNSSINPQNELSDQKQQSEDQDQHQVQNKRQQLKRNLEKNKRKQQELQIKFQQKLSDEQKQQKNNQEGDLLQLDSIFENSENKTFEEQKKENQNKLQDQQEDDEHDLIGDIMGNNSNNNIHNAVFESDDEDAEDNKNKENSLVLDDQEQDIFQKVQNMSDDEEDSEEQQRKNKKNKKQKKKQLQLDESYSFDEKQSDNSDDSEDLYSENSDFDPNEGRRRGGKRKGPVDMRGEPQQRKQRKVLLTKKEVERMKFPYDVGNNLILISPGEIITDQGYHSKYNYFPIGYKCSRQYYSTVTKDAKTTYISEILKGKNKPQFKVSAEDNPSKSVVADSSSQCWKVIAEAAKKLNVGTKKVSISGPEMFGLQNQIIQQILEFLPNAENCQNYYANQVQNKSGNQSSEDQEQSCGSSEKE